MLSALLVALLTSATQLDAEFDRIADCYVTTLTYSRQLAGSQSEEMYNGHLAYDRLWRNTAPNQGFPSGAAAFQDLRERDDAFRELLQSDPEGGRETALACYAEVLPNSNVFETEAAPLPVTFEESMQCYSAILNYTHYIDRNDAETGMAINQWDRWMSRAGRDEGMSQGEMAMALVRSDQDYDEMAQSQPDQLTREALACATRVTEIDGTANKSR
ncbi:MAG: hypothetical protein JJ884_10495 [Maricaulis sp.]|uniref:hypothetical protein n=1 Tax=Maricaulis sp. TaxID=1486257 RepID=UPI001B1984B3|nr:hypothetical protein [Maricaulis sp.]MBO6728896.1 hypothetical protein [Maricaulis sp.]MBO6847935.1 hypothetical protein [Maricaulis sp.]MBO6877687.1 hypothetical protein [Maricaulis sp.]